MVGLRNGVRGGILGALALSVLAVGGAWAAPPPEGGAAASIDLARSLIDAGQYEQAVAVLKQLDAGDPATSARIDLMFGRIYLAIGRPAKALGFYEEASFASLDSEGEATLGIAEADLALGDLAKARRNALLALKSDPDQVGAELVLARVDQRLGHGRQAFDRLRKLQQNRPDSEDVAVVNARYAAEQNGAAAGAAELQRFVARNPQAAGAWDTLGQLLWAANLHPAAIEARTTARDRYLDRGQSGHAEAMDVWLKAVDPQGSHKPPPPPVPEDSHTLKLPTSLPSAEAKEPPPPAASPRPPVESAALPPPPPPTPIQAPKPSAALLPHPEPLPFSPGSKIMTGSGIVLEGGRQVITNRHVIDGMQSIAVRNGTGHVRTARVVKVSSDDDLALLEIDQPFPEAAVTPLADIRDPVPGQQAIVMGYPLINVFGDEQPALTEGIIAKAQGLANDPHTFQMTAKINKGNSGGPVFDQYGHLLGVAVGKADASGIYQKSGTLIEDINLGIKGSRILRFLGKTPSGEPTAQAMSLEDLYQQMLPRAVLVAAQ